MTYPNAVSNETLQQAIEGKGVFPEGYVGVGPDPTFGPAVRPNYHRGAEKILFTLVGNHYRPVLVKDITARVINRSNPQTGTVVFQTGQGATEVPQIGFDLDSSDLAARKLNTDWSPSKERYLDGVQLTLARDEPLEFHATVFTATCYCKFVFDVEFLDGTTQTVDNSGKPWQVSAFATQYQRAYFTDLGENKVKQCTWPDGCQSYPEY